MADKELNGPLGDRLSALVDEVDALEVAEVVGSHPGQEALQLFHVEGTWHVRPVGSGQRPAVEHRATVTISPLENLFTFTNKRHISTRMNTQ